jgi:hypothetical protein
LEMFFAVGVGILCVCVCVCVCVCGIGVWTQGFVFSRWVVYLFSHTFNPKLIFWFYLFIYL